MTIVGHQFITLTVDICVGLQHGGREAPRHVSLSAAARLVCIHRESKNQDPYDFLARLHQKSTDVVNF